MNFQFLNKYNEKFLLNVSQFKPLFTSNLNNNQSYQVYKYLEKLSMSWRNKRHNQYK